MSATPGPEDHRDPLRIAVLVKQVPHTDDLELTTGGRLRRQGAALEMNAFCRRAVAKGVALARASSGSCTAFTLGPPSADEVLREAVAWGADGGVHLVDPAFAGSDTLATARALVAALRRAGPFDLVLLGRASIDGGTAQVGPEVAQLLDLPFAAGARHLRVVDRLVELRLEQEDGWEEVEVSLPAVISVAERLCEPCKVPPEARAAVAGRAIRRVTAADLGEGPWGSAGSPTRVGAVRAFPHARAGRVLSGELAAQVAEALSLLAARGALSGLGHRPVGRSQAAAAHGRAAADQVPVRAPGRPPAGGAIAEPLVRRPRRPQRDRIVSLALVDGDRPQLAAELLGAAARLAAHLGGKAAAVVASAGTGSVAGDRDLAVTFGVLGADVVLEVRGAPVHQLAAEDVSAALVEWIQVRQPQVVLAPSTAFGCEVAARTAAALGAGLIGDAISVDIADAGGVVVAGKPALSGSLVADVTCHSPVQLVTVRPGVLPVPEPLGKVALLDCLLAKPRGRVRIRSSHRDDDVTALARADVVIGVGQGVRPDRYPAVHALAEVLDAELAATRKVTDRGWAPHSRQVGITGRSIAPRLYVAIGLSGTLNHMVGVRAAGTVLAINNDPRAPLFGAADVGIVGDWQDVVPLLTSGLRGH